MYKLLNKNVLKTINSYHKYLVPTEPMVWCLSGYSPNEWMSRRFAGHSKWQNIKHTKLSKDQEKSRIINRLLNKVKYALRNVGGADPKINREFGDVMEMCRKANIPNTTIDKAIKRALEKKSIPIKLEIMGPNGCLIVLDAECVNKSVLRNQVKGVLKKYNGFGFVEDGRAMYAFEEKAIIKVKDRDKDGQQIELEKAEEVAIEADAEEVQHISDEESVLLFISVPQNCHKVKKYIEENSNFEVIDSGIELIPFTRVELPEQTLQLVINAIEELEEMEEVNRVYNNIT